MFRSMVFASLPEELFRHRFALPKKTRVDLKALLFRRPFLMSPSDGIASDPSRQRMQLDGDKGRVPPHGQSDDHL